MGSFGERLQRERELRGITLEEIAEATKIGTRSLRALEEQDFDKLPGGIFNKGFVRAYSKYLGIDEDQSVADYVTAVNEAQSAGKLTRPEYVPPHIDEEVDKPEAVRIPWGFLIVIALVAAVGFAAKSYYAQHGWAKLRRESTTAQSRTSPTTATAKATSSSGSPAVVPTVDAAQKTPAQNDVPAATGSFVVKVHSRESAWLSIKADGKNVISETVAANVDREIRASREVILTTGNAGGIDITHNDKSLGAIGQPGEKKTLVLTPQGLQQ